MNSVRELPTIAARKTELLEHKKRRDRSKIAKGMVCRTNSSSLQKIITFANTNGRP
ncbi:MAG: hypothetical protein AB3A66_15760 [Nodularia sp. CChRGM 3473]